MQIKDGTFMGSVRDQIHSAERAICTVYERFILKLNVTLL